MESSKLAACKTSEYYYAVRISFSFLNMYQFYEGFKNLGQIVILLKLLFL